MPSPTASRVPRARRALRGAGLLALAGLLLTGCSAKEVARLGWPEAITPQGERMLNLFIGAWLASAVVGAFVLGLIVVAVVKYRRHSTDAELPAQVRYNLPIEVLYTIIPFIIVLVLFYYTAIIESDVDSETPANAGGADLTVGVVGFQWNWQFNFGSDTPDNPDDDVSVTGRPGEPAYLILPTDRTIRFVETSPDVIHSFWVPAFLFKRDVIPGRQNSFEITITEPGTYVGRCAELCGVNHDRMNFEVRAVSGDDFDRYIASRGLDVPGTPYPPFEELRAEASAG